MPTSAACADRITTLCIRSRTERVPFARLSLDIHDSYYRSMTRSILLLFAVATLSAAQRPETPAAGKVTLKYLGTAGWEVSDGRIT